MINGTTTRGDFNSQRDILLPGHTHRLPGVSTVMPPSIP
jgi:hypothetical protein